MYYIGIDGGSAFTKLVCVDENAKVIGHHIGNSIDLYRNDKEAAAENLARLLKEFSKLSNINKNEFKALCVGVNIPAREYRTSDKPLEKQQEFYEKAVKDYGMDCKVKVGGLYDLILATEVKNSDGVLVQAALDSLAYTVDKHKKVHICGGWGHNIDGGGSAYWIGTQAIKCALMSYDNRLNPASELMDKICVHFNVKTIPEAAAIIDSDKLNPSTVSELVLAVKYAAESGDVCAAQIQESAAGFLYDTAKALITGTNKQKSKVVLSGAVFVHDDKIRQMFTSLLQNDFKEIQVVLSKEKPEMGAALLAIDLHREVF